MTFKTKNILPLAFGAALAIALAVPGSAKAQKAALLANDCAEELVTFCSNVTPGDNRLVACLIAYEDKISPRCRLTAYMESGNLGNHMKQLKAIGKICSSDIFQYCSKVPAGGGRVYDCLMKHKATLTDDCRNGIPKAEMKLMQP